MNQTTTSKQTTSHVFYKSPLGLEFASKKNGGILLFRISDSSTAKGVLRRGMSLTKANHINISNDTNPSLLPSIISQLGFPLTLTFIPAPSRSEESLHQTLLLKKVQRKFRTHLAKRKARLKSKEALLSVPTLPPKLPARPRTSPSVSKLTSKTVTKLLPNRCTNCGTINNFPSQRLRSLFRVCGLCHLEFDKIPAHPVLFVADIIPPMPTSDSRGPEHSIFTEKQILTLRVLAASLGSGDLPQRAIDVTDELNACITSNGYSDAHNYLELNEGFNCSEKLLNNARLDDEEILSPRSRVSLRSNPCILYTRTELCEPSGFPFRRWTTKQEVINVNGILKIKGPSIILQPPIEPMLKVLPTSFLGNLNDPFLQYPVCESIQASIDLDQIETGVAKQTGGSTAPDQKDGSFLVIGPQNSKLIQDIGDPYPGADKILRLDLDMQGFHGQIVVPCSSGHLHMPISINGPVLAPTLLIRKAMYGAEAPYNGDRRSDIPEFDRELSVEVTMELQRLVDVQGAGESLLLESPDVAIEHLLLLQHGSPAPNAKKKLEIVFERRGIRGRRIIKIRRNGTMEPGNRIYIEAPQLQDSKANKFASASRKFGFSNPRIKIISASYGTALGVRTAQRIDVRSVLQNQVDNSLRNDFSIGIQDNLDQLFGCRMTPWEGCELIINFEIMSFVVRMDLPVRDMKLACEVRLGYLIRPIQSPSPVDSGAAMRGMLGNNKEEQDKNAAYGHGSGAANGSRWTALYDQPKMKSKYAVAVEETAKK